MVSFLVSEREKRPQNGNDFQNISKVVLLFIALQAFFLFSVSFNTAKIQEGPLFFK
jgi:hypothetical protein